MLIRALPSDPDFPVEKDNVFRGCWEYELASGEITETHSHPSGHEIHLILNGRGLITVGTVTREIRERQVFVVPAKAPHSLRNPHEIPLRGLSVEATLPIPAESGAQDSRVTLKDLEETIASIPRELDTPEALQLIIRLFDLAGYLSEQIEHAIGLDTQTGLNAIAAIEKQVMDAVVVISNSYSGGYPSRFPRRF